MELMQKFNSGKKMGKISVRTTARRLIKEVNHRSRTIKFNCAEPLDRIDIRCNMPRRSNVIVKIFYH